MQSSAFFIQTLYKGSLNKNLQSTSQFFNEPNCIIQSYVQIIINRLTYWTILLTYKHNLRN